MAAKPGDVARVRNEYDVWNTAICTVGLGGNTWRFGVALAEQPVEGSAARPLVVIDPEDPDQLSALVSAFHNATESGPLPERAMTVSQLRMRAALLAPPKPDEPTGLGAVVEDAQGDIWVRFKSAEIRPWRKNYPGDDDAAVARREFYADVAAVRVLSEGVTA